MKRVVLQFKVTPSFHLESDYFTFKVGFTERPQNFVRREAKRHYTLFITKDFDYRTDRNQLMLNFIIIECMRERAKVEIPPLVRKVAAEFDLRHNRISIKDIHSRWGSCSSLGNLNFSLWLMLVPPHLVDYVIRHELSHLNEMNHSPRFWAEVDKLYGGVPGKGRAMEREMKAYSRELYRRLAEVRKATTF